MFKSKILKKLGAGLMAGLCAFSMLGANLSGTISAKAASTSTENSAFPTSDKVIAKAAELLGTPYTFGNKGYWGCYNQGEYSELSVSTIKNLGIDCSGLVYYTLTQLGYKTSGFSWNNPVPVDTTHWLSVNDNCTISYGGKTSKIDVEKKNIKTEAHPYWECADGSTITPGSVVVAENPKGIDHAWIYMGEFSNRTEVVNYLKNIGVAENLITSVTVGSGNGDGGMHWRIESNGSQGVVINNNTDGKKTTALNTSAFRITQTDVTFSIKKCIDGTSQIVGKSAVDGSTAKYGVYSDKVCKTKVGEIMIGEKGTGSIKLSSGTYYVKELSAPKGYALSTKVYELKTNQTVTVYEKFQTGKIKINKTAEDDIVKDIEFKVTGSDGSSYTKKTDSKGFTEFSALNVYDMKTGKAVTYTVSEINVAERYEVPKAQNITLTSGDADLTVNVNFVNDLKKGSIKINKQSEDGQNGDREFQIAGAGKTYTIKTGADGTAILSGLPVYDSSNKKIAYTISEKNVPIKYVVPADQTAKISIIKHSDDGTTQIETPEKGAEFEVYLKSAGSFEAANEYEKDYLICDENGYASTKMLPYGVYIVHQTKGWENTEWMPDFEVNICENEKEYFYLINDAVLTSYVKIVKKDAETGNVIPVSGIGFKVWDCTNNSYVSQKINYPSEMILDTFYTDESGSLMLPNELVYGNYELHEVQSAEGYVLDKNPIPFTIDGAVETLIIEKFNTAQKGKISVQKTGDTFVSVGAASSAYTDENGEMVVNPTTYTPIFEKKGLPGAVYQVIAAEDIVTPDGTVRASAGGVVAEITTDENGYAETDCQQCGIPCNRRNTGNFAVCENFYCIHGLPQAWSV